MIVYNLRSLLCPGAIDVTALGVAAFFRVRGLGCINRAGVEIAADRMMRITNGRSSNLSC